MVPMAVTAAVTSFFSFVLGYLVYRRNPGTRETTLFLVMTVLLGTWGVIAVFACSAAELTRFIALYRAGFVFQMLYLGAFLQFALLITGSNRTRSAWLYWVYVPCVAAIPFFFGSTGTLDEYSRVGEMWCFTRRYSAPAMLFPAAVWVTYYAVSAVLFFRESLRATTAVEKRVPTVLGGLVVVILAATLLEGIFLPAAFGTPSVGPDLPLTFAWLLCVGLLVDRCNFMAASEKLEDTALTEFPECAVFVLDSEYTIRKTNREASVFFSVPPDELLGAYFGTILPTGERLLAEMEKLKRNGTASVAGVVEITRKGRFGTLMDVKASLLRDKGGSLMGFIVIGNPVPGVRRAEAMLHLTNREIDVIEQILRGHTNKSIANCLGISERTVKSHLTAIFGKLGIESRTQLYALLKTNHFISDHVAEKNVLVLRNHRN